jgi:hypothetical protein
MVILNIVKWFRFRCEDVTRDAVQMYQNDMLVKNLGKIWGLESRGLLALVAADGRHLMDKPF